MVYQMIRAENFTKLESERNKCSLKSDLKLKKMLEKRLQLLLEVILKAQILIRKSEIDQEADRDPGMPEIKSKIYIVKLTV